MTASHQEISTTGTDVTSSPPGGAVEALRAARDFLLTHREDHDAAYAGFEWPRPEVFNWALDWFDGVLAVERPDQTALWIVEEDGGETRLTFAELSEASTRVATWLAAQGVRRGDRILLMLANQVELWETLLAAMKLGAVVIPASTLLGTEDLRARVERGGVRHVVARSADTDKFSGVPGEWTPIAVGETVAGWRCYADWRSYRGEPVRFGTTRADEPLLLYFTSGTTAEPKLVEHTHRSYPVGHLSTMYWLGLRPGDVHLNISSPGWGKHAWSNVFAPWLAGATVLVVNYTRFRAPKLLAEAVRCGVTTFCAPPTVWRMLIQADLSAWQVAFRECVSAGEPLNPEIIRQVERAWGVTVRDGYGQTETTAQIGNPPGQRLVPGSMGRALPGYAVTLADPVTGLRLADSGPAEGEICLDLATYPVGLMVGYRDDPERTKAVMKDGLYRTGDIAARDADGYLTYVGRADDVFKASDYRISPFELESALIEHEAVVEAAVVPSPDPVRLAVAKAYVSLADGYDPDAATALAILRFARQRLAPFQRVRRIEFGELPKTISGKNRRVALREREATRHGTGVAEVPRAPFEYWEEDFPDLKHG